jgi:hypothetical protein
MFFVLINSKRINIIDNQFDLKFCHIIKNRLDDSSEKICCIVDNQFATLR